MRNAHCSTWNMARKLEIMENENTHFRRGNMARKTGKGGIFRDVPYRILNMARKLKIMENEKYPFEHLKNDEITENVKYKKCTLLDLKYDEKTEKHRK
jgi:tRNA(Ile)-lysidine synthase TilS/MesJ